MYEKYLNVGEIDTFYYFIKPQKPGTYTSNPRITYTDVNRIKEIHVEPIEISVLEPPVQIAVDKIGIGEIGETINLTVSLDKDIVSEIIIKNFEIHVPKGLVLVEYQNLSYDPNLR